MKTRVLTFIFFLSTFTLFSQTGFDDKIQKTEKQLKEAVQNQNYEEAAKLKQELEVLQLKQDSVIVAQQKLQKQKISIQEIDIALDGISQEIDKTQQKMQRAAQNQDYQAAAQFKTEITTLTAQQDSLQEIKQKQLAIAQKEKEEFEAKRNELASKISNKQQEMDMAAQNQDYQAAAKYKTELEALTAQQDSLLLTQPNIVVNTQPQPNTNTVANNTSPTNGTEATEERVGTEDPTIVNNTNTPVIINEATSEPIDSAKYKLLRIPDQRMVDNVGFQINDLNEKISIAYQAENYDRVAALQQEKVLKEKIRTSMLNKDYSELANLQKQYTQAKNNSKNFPETQREIEIKRDIKEAEIAAAELEAQNNQPSTVTTDSEPEPTNNTTNTNNNTTYNTNNNTTNNNTTYNTNTNNNTTTNSYQNNTNQDPNKKIAEGGIDIITRTNNDATDVGLKIWGGNKGFYSAIEFGVSEYNEDGYFFYDLGYALCSKDVYWMIGTRPYLRSFLFDDGDATATFITQVGVYHKYVGFSTMLEVSAEGDVGFDIGLSVRFGNTFK
ncbi:MAG: hypothetical protein GY827_10385 [Cytophagales bacterium]|nr:hypothetical protein [Cytophagales bacterium]